MSSVSSRSLAFTAKIDLRANEPAANDATDAVSHAERMTWLIELMSRYARELAQSSDGHQSTRIAAAIVTHLRTLVNETPNTARLNDASEHWFDIWDGILSRQLNGATLARDESLRALVLRAQAF